MRTLKAATLLLALSSLAAANQILNGDFSSGDSSFTSSYHNVPANGTVQTQPGDFALITNPARAFPNGYFSYTDHTGDPAALMLFVDGYYPGTAAWSEVVPVVPSTSYKFTGWVASAYSANTAVLGLFADGKQVGASFNSSATPGLWTEWTASLTSGPAASQINLSIQDLNPNVYGIGDDFTIDDLSLNGASTPTPEPCFALIILPALAGLIAFRRKQRAIVRS